MSIFNVNGEEEMVALARRWTESLPAKTVFALHGELGVGKTRFAQGVAQALGVTEAVCSPTFAIAQEYRGQQGRRFIHFDLYRLKDEQAVEDFGFEEMLARADVAVVEWPERAGQLLPENSVHIAISFGTGEMEREVDATMDKRLCNRVYCPPIDSPTKGVAMKSSTVTTTAIAAAMLQTACAQDLPPIELKAPNLARESNLMQAFSKRASSLSVEDKMLSIQDLSDLLWAGNGVNRPEEKKRTAPSAVNAQDVDIYVFLAEGAYLYDAFDNVLKPVAKGDFREQVIMPSRMNAATPPVLLLLICDVSRFTIITDEAMRVKLAAMDAGIVSQNIALFCAGAGMATRPRASNNVEKLKEVLNLTDSQIPMLNHPVGYAAPSEQP